MRQGRELLAGDFVELAGSALGEVGLDLHDGERLLDLPQKILIQEPLPNLSLQDHLGLRFAPPFQVASLTPDPRGRWRAVLADGAVAYRPGPPPPGPWVRLGHSLVLPGLLRKVRNRWLDPAGFDYPYQPLEPVLQPPPGPELPGLPCHPDAIVTLRGTDTETVWYTDLGLFPCQESAAQAAARHPELVLCKRGDYFHRRRLQRVVRDQTRHKLVLDDGSFLLVSHKNHFEVANRLGLPHFYHLEPFCPALYRDHLREYPYELARALGPRLQADFSEQRQLIANLIWQALRYREEGRRTRYGKDYRAFWYTPVKTTLYRAGFLTRADLEDRLPESTPSYHLLQTILAELVGDDRLFTFQELGFKDTQPHLRKIGKVRPEVIFVCEKISLSDTVDCVARRFGVSTVILGGQPSLQETEYFVKALRQRWSGPVILIACVDYDPYGWIIANSFASQLARYGVESPQGITGYVVRPEFFSAEDLELFAIPVPANSPATQAKLDQWMRQTNGVNGQPLGLHANDLDPARMVAAFRDLFEGLGGPGTAQSTSRAGSS